MAGQFDEQEFGPERRRATYPESRRWLREPLMTTDEVIGWIEKQKSLLGREYNDNKTIKKMREYAVLYGREPWDAIKSQNATMIADYLENKRNELRSRIAKAEGDKAKTVAIKESLESRLPDLPIKEIAKFSGVPVKRQYLDQLGKSRRQKKKRSKKTRKHRK